MMMLGLMMTMIHVEIAEAIEKLADNKEQVIEFIMKQFNVKHRQRAENLYKETKEELEKNPNFIKDTINNLATGYEKLVKRDLELLNGIKGKALSQKKDTWIVPDKITESKDELDPDKLGFKIFNGEIKCHFKPN